MAEKNYFSPEEIALVMGETTPEEIKEAKDKPVEKAVENAEEKQAEEDTTLNEDLLKPAEDASTETPQEEEDKPTIEGEEEPTESEITEEKPIEEDKELHDKLEQTIDERLKQLEEESKRSPEDDNIAAIKRDMQLADQLLTQDPLAESPRDGVFIKNGKLVYEMTRNELNEYLQELDDNGKYVEKNEIQNEINRAIEKVKERETLRQTRQTLEAQLNQSESIKRNTQEWNEVEKHFINRLPEIKPYIGKLAQFIEQKAQNNPQEVDTLSSTLSGKKELVWGAIKELGILDELKRATKKDEDLPVTPDSDDSVKKSKMKTADNNKTKSGKKILRWSHYKDLEPTSKEWRKVENEIMRASMEGRMLIDQ